MFYKYVVISFLITTSFLYSSQDIESYLKYETGKTSYYVNNRSETNFLESKLVFPIKSYLFGLKYSQTILYDTSITIGYEKQINNTDTSGEDFDWQNHIQTVYSYSKNHLTNNEEYIISVVKPINIHYINNLRLSISQKKLLFNWYNTQQSNQSNVLTGNTLQYEQIINKYSSSLLSNKSNQNFLYSFNINFYDINAIDRHLLRNLTTQTSYSGIGYQYSLGYKYNVDTENTFKINYEREKFQSNNFSMYYYSYDNYIGTYPSATNIDLEALQIAWIYVF